MTGQRQQGVIHIAGASVEHAISSGMSMPKTSPGKIINA